MAVLFSFILKVSLDQSLWNSEMISVSGDSSISIINHDYSQVNR